MERPTDVDMAFNTLFAVGAASEATALRAYIESLERDAARYRLVRQHPQALGRMDVAQALGLDLTRVYLDTPEKLDAAIDAAIAQQRGEG